MKGKGLAQTTARNRLWVVFKCVLNSAELAARFCRLQVAIKLAVTGPFRKEDDYFQQTHLTSRRLFLFSFF